VASFFVIAGQKAEGLRFVSNNAPFFKHSFMVVQQASFSQAPGGLRLRSQRVACEEQEEEGR
jgi:hypothetical protein